MATFNFTRDTLGEHRLKIMIDLGVQKVTDTQKDPDKEVPEVDLPSLDSKVVPSSTTKEAGQKPGDVMSENPPHLYERRLPVNGRVFSYGAHFVPQFIPYFGSKDSINCNTFYTIWKDHPEDMKKMFSKTDDTSSGEGERIGEGSPLLGEQKAPTMRRSTSRRLFDEEKDKGLHGSTYDLKKLDPPSTRAVRPRTRSHQPPTERESIMKHLRFQELAP